MQTKQRVVAAAGELSSQVDLGSGKKEMDNNAFLEYQKSKQYSSPTCQLLSSYLRNVQSKRFAKNYKPPPPPQWPDLPQKNS